MRKSIRYTVVAVAVVLGLSPLGFAQVAAFGQTIWYVDDDACPGPGSGSDVDPFCKIQDAIDAAALSGDEIIVLPGTYNELINFNGKGVHLRSADPSDPEVVAATIIDGTGLGGSVVSCVSGEGPDTILEGFTITGGVGHSSGDYKFGGGMYIDAMGPTVQGCTFTGNTADAGGGLYNYTDSQTVITSCIFQNNAASIRGGGIYNSFCAPVITGCSFTHNIAELDGGGIRNNQSNTIVRDCIFSNNTAMDNGGGMANLEGHITIENSDFVSNLADKKNLGDGGGIYNYTTSFTISGCSFITNTASAGGGIGTIDSDSMIIDSTFTNNTANGGGGMYIDGYGIHEITSCRFSENKAKDNGGGMLIGQSDPLIFDCLFEKNIAGSGGGMRATFWSDPQIVSCVFEGNVATGGVINPYDNLDAVGGGMLLDYECKPLLHNCLFTGNRANKSGGGIYSEHSHPMITNSTFSGNTAIENGGGLCYDFNYNSTATNSIFWGNSAGVLGSQIYLVFAIKDLTISYSDIQGSGGSENWDSSLSIDGGGNIDIDPMFVRNPDDGGDGWGDDPLTLEVDEGDNDDFGDPRLQITSSAINTGLNDYVPADMSDIDYDGDKYEKIPYDLDGSERFVTTINPPIEPCTLHAVDMGAYEFAADCNSNGIADDLDPDADGDGTPDECDSCDGFDDTLDSDQDDIADACDRCPGFDDFDDADVDGVIDGCEHPIIFVDRQATGSSDGNSWTNALTDLHTALLVTSNRAGSYTEIWVAAGTYTPSQRICPLPDQRDATFWLYPNVHLYGGFLGNAHPSGGEIHLSQRDPGSNQTILSGDLSGNDGDNFTGYEENCYHVVTTTNTDTNTLIDGFTITGGNADGNDDNRYSGGGMYNDYGSLTVNNCKFIRNRSISRGGGMYNAYSNSYLTNNLYHSNISGAGGAMFNVWNEKLSIAKCKYINNSAYHVSYSNCSGGAIHTVGNHEKITKCLFIGNKSKGIGGAIYNSDSIEITHSVFFANQSQFGGGIYIRSFPNRIHDVLISNNLFMGNIAIEIGGGISNNNRSNPQINHCTFSHNISEIGLGNSVANDEYSYPTITNSVFSNDGLWIYNEVGSIPNVSFNHLSNGNLYGSNDGGGNLIGNPMFVRNPNDGGDGWGDDPLTLEVDEGANDDFGDLRLQVGSPCINAGDTNFVAEVGASDLDDHPRVLCDIVDMGAYEFGIGDYDCDQMVTMIDFSAWESCFTDPDGGLIEVGCEAFDFNADYDVDLQDFAEFQHFYSGL